MNKTFGACQFLKALLLFFVVAVFVVACKQNEQKFTSAKIQSNFDFSEQQITGMLVKIGSTEESPRSTNEGELRLVKSSDWTSGFFPGNLWYLYEFTRDEKWKKAADYYSMFIEKEKLNGRTHDMGFKLFCSFGNGYRLTNNIEYKEILLEGARTLSTRFNPKIGCIRSWDHNSDKWDYPVIIDNMLNLEMLFWATRETRDSSFYKIAVAHAEKTMQNHFRDDYSCYHVVSYDTITGEVAKKNTHQGFAHESSWARGQAWALYGFTMVYRETGDKRFLDQANHIAKYILNHPHLPADGVPYWDFDAPNIPNEPRDASAAAVIASALYELGLYESEINQQRYFKAADHILTSLSSSEYLSELGDNHYFLLEHSVGSLPKNDEVDVPLIYADYYFLEANLRRLKINGDWQGEKASVVIKVDDLVVNREGEIPEQWEAFAKLVHEKQLPVAAGIVGSSLEKAKPSFIEWVKANHESGLFEFWNHGQLHKRNDNKADFFNRTVEEQVAQLHQTQKLAMAKLGFELTTFGAPYNWSDSNTVVALSQFPEIKVWLYAPDKAETDKIVITRIPEMNIEYPVHNASFYPFFNSYYFYSNVSVMAIQGHPLSWDSARLHQMELIMNYLKQIGTPVIKPSEIIERF